MYLGSLGACSSSPRIGSNTKADVVDIVMGIMFLRQTTAPTGGTRTSVPLTFGIPYFTISLSFNILLTLMIVIRLILHTRNLRTATGITEIGGLCRAIIVMLIESCALYAVVSLLVIGPWVTGNHVADLFVSILTQTQVCALLRLQSSHRLANMMTNWTGHRPIAHHPTSRE